MIKRLVFVSLLQCLSAWVLASENHFVGSVKNHQKINLSELEAFPLLVLAKPDQLSFELKSLGFVDVVVDVRQRLADGTQLISGHLLQAGVYLPNSKVTLLDRGAAGITGRVETANRMWSISENPNTKEYRLYVNNMLPNNAQLVAINKHGKNSSKFDISYPEWQPNVAYTGGTIVRHNGQLYRTLWWNRSQRPDETGMVQNPWIPKKLWS